MAVTISPDNPQIAGYYERLSRIRERGGHSELHVRPAFQGLLDNLALVNDWQLIPEFRLRNGRVPDGTLIDDYKIPRGYWEAKDTADDLETEIDKKVAVGYPLRNTLFEDTRRAVLYQNKQRVYTADLSKPDEVARLVSLFLSHTDPQIEEFHKAVAQFAHDVKDLAAAILTIIEEERAASPGFKGAYENFYELCQSALNKNISRGAVDEMLVQHLLTERLARTVLESGEFTRRNVIAAELEKVMDALFKRHYSRSTLLAKLDYFYETIEAVGREIDDFSEKQKFINTLYERFFQGFSSKTADTHGIVYTPQEIVDFMCESVETLLNRDFGLSITSPDVVILDPATGTGNFVVNLLRRIARIRPSALKEKYRKGLFANEVMLLPYYVASLNIEHTYYELAGEYADFEGICFADTLDMYAGKQAAFQFAEENTERVNAEKAAPITVIIGNPPYNVGQINENDNNKNRKYPDVDKSIRETYAKDSKATLSTKLYDAYVRFFRWASDRLGGRDGVIAFVTNNGFLEGIAFDAFRRSLLKEFDQIYHVDLGGNSRTSGLSKTGGNVFDIRVGVGITLLVKNKKANHGLYYYQVGEEWTKNEKLSFLSEMKDVSSINWQQLVPDSQGNWLNEGLQTDFENLIPMGTKESKARNSTETETIFRTFSLGVSTNRDDTAYDFRFANVANKVKRFIDNFNAEVGRFRKSDRKTSVDDFVNYDLLKWSRNLKRDLKNLKKITFHDKAIVAALYRPFTKQFLYLSDTVVDESGTSPAYFNYRNDDRGICLSHIGFRTPFSSLMVSHVPDLHLLASADAYQCFPLYTYAVDGAIRKENITDWALGQFRAYYGKPDIEKPDIFHYVYAVLHHPEYRTRYAENLKRELPRIPTVGTAETFAALADAGKALGELHVGYETVAEYPLKEVVTSSPHRPFTWRVEAMKPTPDRTGIVVNKTLTLTGIPPEAWEYRLGNRSALDWIIDQYRVSTDKRSGITSDPNRDDDPEYIVRLIKRIVTVSLGTRRIVAGLPPLGLG